MGQTQLSGQKLLFLSWAIRFPPSQSECGSSVENGSRGVAFPHNEFWEPTGPTMSKCGLYKACIQGIELNRSCPLPLKRKLPIVLLLTRLPSSFNYNLSFWEKKEHSLSWSLKCVLSGFILKPSTWEGLLTPFSCRFRQEHSGRHSFKTPHAWFAFSIEGAPFDFNNMSWIIKIYD